VSRTRLPRRLLFGLCIGLATSVAVLLAVIMSGTSRADSFLSDSFAGDSNAYYQQYLIGHDAFVSSPELISSSSAPLRIDRVRPVLTGSCQIHVIKEEAYSAAGPSSGYFPTGPFTATHELGSVVGIKGHADIRHLTFDRFHPAQWYDTFTFSVPGECAVRISGFAIKYTVSNESATEYLAEHSTFLPVHRFHS
jgi:hypothetical protein